MILINVSVFLILKLASTTSGSSITVTPSEAKYNPLSNPGGTVNNSIKENS